METVQIVALIRESSRAGELLALADIEAERVCRDIPASDRAMEPVPVATLIHEATLSHKDIREIQDDSGAGWYFSEQFMTGAYARVLLLKGQGPFRMMAEVIREHSRIYPRPVPLSLFQCSPFELSHDEIVLCLEEMRGRGPYRDIAHLTTSIGNLFAYSTDHLESAYAAMLAEWMDVGQARNP